MSDLKNEKLAIPLVIIAGLIWSFGPLIVRNIDNANTIPWQYLFSRGLVIFILLNVYLILEEGIDFYKKAQLKNLQVVIKFQLNQIEL